MGRGRIKRTIADQLFCGGVPDWEAVPYMIDPRRYSGFGIYHKYGAMGLSEEAGAGALVGIPGYTLKVTNAALTTADTFGGPVMLTTLTTNEDTGQCTLGSPAGGGAFWPAAGEKIVYEARLKYDEATLADFNLCIGLQDPSATEYMGDAGAGPAVNNHLLFMFADGDGLGLQFEGDKAGVADTNDLSVARASLSWMTVGFVIHGITTVDVYVNRVRIAAGQVATASIPVLGMMPAFCIKTGAVGGEASVIYVDYQVCVQFPDAG